MGETFGRSVGAPATGVAHSAARPSNNNSNSNNQIFIALYASYRGAGGGVTVPPREPIPALGLRLFGLGPPMKSPEHALGSAQCSSTKVAFQVRKCWVPGLDSDVTTAPLWTFILETHYFTI